MSDQIPDSNKHSTALNSAKEKTSEQGRQLWQIIKKHSNAEQLAAESPEQTQSPPPKQQEHSSTALNILTLFPYLLVAAFVISFFWDFAVLFDTLLGYPLNFSGLLEIVCVSGFIGFLPSWVVITMLFKPARKRPLLGHGLIPAQKNRTAYRLAQGVS